MLLHGLMLTPYALFFILFRYSLIFLELWMS